MQLKGLTVRNTLCHKHKAAGLGLKWTASKWNTKATCFIPHEARFFKAKDKDIAAKDFMHLLYEHKETKYSDNTQQRSDVIASKICPLLLEGKKTRNKLGYEFFCEHCVLVFCRFYLTQMQFQVTSFSHTTSSSVGRSCFLRTFWLCLAFFSPVWHW